MKGIPASPGIVYGKVFLKNTEEARIEKKIISKKQINSEIEKFNIAIAKTKKEMKQLHKKVLMEIGEKHASLFYAYLLILEDTLFKEDIIYNINQGMNVEYALQTVLDNVQKTFSTIEDHYLKERERDIIDVVKKIISNLDNKILENKQEIDGEDIIVAHSLTPTDTMSIKTKNVKAFLTNVGGRTSHTAIFAQALQIPAVVGLHNVTKKIKNGDMVIVDGYKGVVVIKPSKEEVIKYLAEKKKLDEIDKKLEKIRDLPAITKDGVEINLLANIEIADEIESVLLHGARGIGLYRTEFLYVDRKDFPSEEEQYEKYKFVAESMLPYSITIRTIDVGGDKFVDRLGVEKERNPFLGLRGIRFSLKYKEIFRTQLRAILRASVHGKIKIMYPMISSYEELCEVNEFVEQVKSELKKENIHFRDNMKLGAMIEVPSAAFTVDLLAEKADFFSIGTNDLIQYSFAVDRANENVSNLYKPHHIAILRLLKFIIDNSKGREVSMCGAMASDAKLIKVLLGLGFRNLSMSAVFVPKIKEIVREVSILECQKLVEKIWTLKTESEILKLLK
jgi:phosphotransferase system enzyme I (PtsI)